MMPFPKHPNVKLTLSLPRATVVRWRLMILQSWRIVYSSRRSENRRLWGKNRFGAKIGPGKRGRDFDVVDRLGGVKTIVSALKYHPTAWPASRTAEIL